MLIEKDTEMTQMLKWSDSGFKEAIIYLAEAPILWLSDAKSYQMQRVIGKDSNAGKDWRQKEKKAAEDEMVR